MKNILPGIFSTMALLASLPLAAATLTPGAPVELAGTHGKFDFIKMDLARHRLLACHTGNGSLDVIDLASSKLIKSVPTDAAQGVAVDEKNGRYFVSVSKPPKLVIIDATKLEIIGEVPLPGPADLVAYHPAANRVFVCNDEKPELWIIDPEAKKILTTLTLPGSGMEDLNFNSQGTCLFQNLKDTSELVRIDTKADTIIGKTSTAPADKPHGSALVPDADALLIAGGTGKLSLESLATGHVLASADIALRVDEIAYDSNLKRAYCASGLGTISVVSVGSNNLHAIEAVPSSPGAHSIAVDPKTHTVWIAFAKDTKAYVQPFSAIGY